MIRVVCRTAPDTDVSSSNEHIIVPFWQMMALSLGEV